MNFKQLAINRYSCRTFLPKKVEDNLIIELLETAKLAPSAKNLQPWHFLIIRNENLKKIKSCYSRDWISEATVVIIICGDHSISWKRDDGKDHCDIDIAIITDHLSLAATELGLGTCWVCNFDAKKCKELFEIPSHIEPIALIPLGYPADKCDEERHLTKRKKIVEMIHWEKF